MVAETKQFFATIVREDRSILEFIDSDYTFAKDELFAWLNLKDDELSMYGRVHAALSEKIPVHIAYFTNKSIEPCTSSSPGWRRATHGGRFLKHKEHEEPPRIHKATH